jgi:hypothetical protein
MSESNSNAERPSTPLPSPEEEPSGMPDVAAPAPGKAGRARVIRPEDVDQMSIRILAFIKRQGDRVTVSQLKRGLNAYRYPHVYEAAIQQLLDIGAVRLEKEPASRRQWISLLETPERFQATPSIPKPRRHPPRSRGRTPWFELHLAKQTLKNALDLWVDDVRANVESKRRAARAIRTRFW